MSNVNNCSVREFAPDSAKTMLFRLYIHRRRHFIKYDDFGTAQ